LTMEKPIQKHFYQKEDALSLRFFRTPKVLYYSSLYRSLSLPAKALYSILLDRLELSIKNRWVDDQGRVFILFRGKPAQDDNRRTEDKPPENFSLTEILNVDHRSLKKYKNELSAHHLLEEVRSGQGKSNRLYLFKPVADSKDTYKKETPEQMLYSEDRENLSMYEIHELLLDEFGSTALEKAFALTADKKLPVKGYYGYMRRILEGFRKDADSRRLQFLAKQVIPYTDGSFGEKSPLKKAF